MGEPERIPDSTGDILAGADDRLMAIAARLRARGDGDSLLLAEELEMAAQRLAIEEADLKRRLIATLSVNHDINNALVGVFGNAQLLSLGPAVALPGVKERLDVIQREATRIKQATLRLSELKHTLVLADRSPGRAAS